MGLSRTARGAWSLALGTATLIPAGLLTIVAADRVSIALAAVSAFLRGMFRGSLGPSNSPWEIVEPFLWLGGVGAAFLIAWTLIIHGVGLIWRRE